MRKVNIHYKYGCRTCGSCNIRPDEEFCSEGTLIYMCDNCNTNYEDIRKWTKRKLANRILDLFFWDSRGDNPPIIDFIDK